MNYLNGLDAPITRRNWVVLAAATLAGCGGGTNVAGLPGTGGTGIFAQGTIAGFGSVIVNGVKFTDTAATVTIDGAVARPADLRLGMVAEVTGQRGASAVLGIASQIDVWSIAQGQVEQLQTGQFVVAGMTIETGAATVYDGIGSTAALVAGQPVTVWGLQADGGRWRATRIALLPSAPGQVVSSGVVTVRSGQRSVNDMPLLGTMADSMTAGQLVRLQGVLSNTGLQLTQSSALELPSGTLAQHELEIEGVVTAVQSATRFVLGNVEVDASAVSASPLLPVSPGQRIEVHGVLQGELLKASSLELETDQTLQQAEIEAVVEQFTSRANFVVRGQRCDASSPSVMVTKGDINDLRLGVEVKVDGRLVGDVLLVSTIEIG